MSELRPEDLPDVLEKRKLDEHLEAWMLSNGSVALINSVGEIETLLTAERAYNLLNFLSHYGLTFLQILHPKTLALGWKKTEGRLLACLQQAADFYQERADEPGVVWRVMLMSPLSGLAEDIYTPQELLTSIAETPDTVNHGYATLFYDDKWQGSRYGEKLVFAALYLDTSVPSDKPVALFYRVEKPEPN